MSNDPRSHDATPENLRPENVRPENVKPKLDSLVPESIGMAPESEPGTPEDIKARRAREEAECSKGNKP